MATHETIFLAHDNGSLIRVATKVIEMEGHQVVGTATHLEQVRAFLDDPSRPGFSLAIVSDWLPEPEDGEKAAELIRERQHGVTIIALTYQPTSFGDINLSISASPDSLLKAIREVPPRSLPSLRENPISSNP